METNRQMCLKTSVHTSGEQRGAGLHVWYERLGSRGLNLLVAPLHDGQQQDLHLGGMIQQLLTHCYDSSRDRCRCLFNVIQLQIQTVC